jgi:hypothetical protein
MIKHYQRGALTSAILRLIQRKGPQSCATISRELHINHDTSRAMLSRLHRTQRLYICRWNMFVRGARRYPRAVYALYRSPENIDATKQEGTK